MTPMSNPYQQNPNDPSSGQNPYSQPSANPYSQPSANPYEQPSANPYSQPSANPYEQQQYAAAPYGQAGATSPYGQPYGAPAEHPQGTLILIFGILGIFVGIFAPVAWYMGNKANKEIKATGAQYSNQQSINIGRILGMVFTILYILTVLISIAAVIIFAVAAGTTTG